MELSGLGAVHTIVANAGSPSSGGRGGSGFASMIAGLMRNGATSSQGESANLASNSLSSEELVELQEFLQITDIFELENGVELLGETPLPSNGDIVKIIEEQLGLSKEELLQLLSNFYKDMTSKVNEQSQPKNVQDSNNETSQLDMILSFIQLIASLQKQEMKVEPTKDFGQAMKAIKLFELLSANQESIGDQLKLKEFMKNINEKLELAFNSGRTIDKADFALHSGGTIDKTDFAKKTFQALVNELGGKTAADSEKSANVVKALVKTETVNHQGFIQFQQFSKPEQLTLLSSSGRPVTTEQLIQQFESILSKSQLIKTGGTQRLFIKLNPEHLGSLRIELIQKDSGIIARILTSTANAKDMMESQLNGLKQAFHSQNIQVERIEISQSFTQQDRGFNRDPQQQGQERQQQQEQQQQEQQSADFNHSFEEALLNTEA